MVLDTNTLLIQRDFGLLPATLSQTPNWSLVYFNTDALLYVKTSSVSDDFLKDHALKYIDFGRNLGFDPAKGQEAIRELTQFINRYPDNVEAIGQLASIYRITGDFSSAQKLLDTIPEAKRTYAVNTEFGRVSAAQGHCVEAERYFLKALKEKPEMMFSRTVLDLAVLYAGCFKDTKTAAHYFSRFDSYQLPPDERERVRVLMKDFDITLPTQ